MVTLAGQSILEGKHLSEGGVSPRDWAHFMIALLCHDIGYIKGICADDDGYLLATGNGRERSACRKAAPTPSWRPITSTAASSLCANASGKKSLWSREICWTRIRSPITSR